MNLTGICFTPKNITKGLDVIRQMKSLKTIGVAWEAKDHFPADEFWKKYDAGEFGKAVTTFNDPAFKRWMKGVAALPAEQQAEAVAKKLRELNPAFDGKVTGFWGIGMPRIENGVVTGFGFGTDNVTDISPVRALERLRSLTLGNDRNHRNKFSDLSPLKGMPLTTLDCSHTQVSDLSPLRGMLLTFLHCGGTPVSNLSPLKGMPLTLLRCECTKASDLSPLAGMPLSILYCDNTHVADLSSLRGMPLTDLRFFATLVSNLSPLEGMNLTTIVFTPKNMTKGMDAIRQMKSLKNIGISAENNGIFPPAEFWKKYDAGEFNK
jgi:hypothetical protein